MLSFLRSLLFVSALISSGALWAQNKKVEELLKKAQLKYSVDKDGDFKLVFDVGDGRSQVLFINSQTEEMGGQEIVEIWSPAYKGTASQQGSLGLGLLLASNNKKIGAWQAVRSEDQVFFLFKAKVPLSALTPNFIKAVCAGVAATADEVENELTQADNF